MDASRRYRLGGLAPVEVGVPVLSGDSGGGQEALPGARRGIAGGAG